MEITTQPCTPYLGKRITTIPGSSRRGQTHLWLLISLVLLVIGIGVTVYGISVGLRALNGLYTGAVNDAMGQPEGTEQRVSTEMLNGVLIGAAGLIPLIGGTVMYRVWKARRLAYKRNTNKLDGR